MNAKLLSFLGLARRAGRLALGFDAASDAMLSGKCRLLILASDLSERTIRSITRTANQTQTRTIVSDISMNDLGCAIGKQTGIVAVNDKGFADKLETLFSEQRQEE